MKRFIEIALIVLALAMAAYLVFFRANLPLDVHRGEELSMPFRVQGTELQQKKDNDYETVRLRGVELSSALPGRHFSDYAATKDDYARWLDQIDDLGANAVVIPQLMDDEFYDALLEHNQSAQEPLLLVQGIMVEDALEHDSENAYGSGLMDRLTKQGKTTVDAIHGRRDVAATGIGGSGTYRSDVSQWVASLLIMDEFDVDNVALTDNSTVHEGAFEGDYFATTSDATAFEAMLAQVMDDVVTYETMKYDTQRPIGFTGGVPTDPLEYEEVYARQLGKYVCVNAEHVVPTKKNAAGRIGAYRITNVPEGFAEYLSDACKKSLGSLLEGLDRSALYDGYLQLLSAYHTMPLVAFFSGSSARATASPSAPAMNEQAQGEALCAVSSALDDADWTGTIISSWQDVWTRSIWNTKFATYVDNTYLWHDVQTPTQCEGLLAFDPGKKDACVLDGVADEWSADDVVVQTEDATVSARYDAEGLYLLVQGVSAGEVAYVPLDVSRETGVTSCADPDLTFARAAEFVLVQDGTTGGKLLVQSHCDATRERFLFETQGIDPFIETVAADDPTFAVSQLAIDSDQLLSEEDWEANKHVYRGLLDTGELVEGNGDPTSDAYNSLADVCHGQDCIEVRLPWLMLNVGDPSNMLVHRDYYDHYGVEFKKTKYISMGVAKAGTTDVIPMSNFYVHGWKRVPYRERLKQSYYAVQASWTEGE